MSSETVLKENLKNLLDQVNYPPGLIIAWGHGHFSELQQAVDLALRYFTQGLIAWLNGDYSEAATAWSACQAAGLNGFALEDLLHLAKSATNPILSVYVDGSFDPRDRTGGAACVYQLQDYIGMLARHLPGPLPGNHYAEAEALRLALTAPALTEYPLVIYTDSQTLMAALDNSTKVSLSPETTKLVSKIAKLRAERDATIRFTRSRTGQLLHDQADKLSRWVRILGEYPNSTDT